MKKILLVEDNELNRDMLSRRLLRHGYEIITAENGQEAISLANSQTPDLILLDMSLPLLNGWETAKILKKTISSKSIPIIALTAHATENDKTLALESGCDDFDTKPIELPRLLQKIQRLLCI